MTTLQNLKLLLIEFGLTKRQTQLCIFAYNFKSNKEMAKELGLAYVTIDMHFTRIHKKFKVKSRLELLDHLNKILHRSQQDELTLKITEQMKDASKSQINEVILVARK